MPTIIHKNDYTFHYYSGYFTEKGIPEPKVKPVVGHIKVLPGAFLMPNPLYPDSHWGMKSYGTMKVAILGDYVFLGDWNLNFGTQEITEIGVKIVGPATTKVHTYSVIVDDLSKRQNSWSSAWTRKHENITEVDSYGAHVRIPYAYLPVEFTIGGEAFVVQTKWEQPDFGTATLDPNGGPTITVTSDFFGMTRTWTETLKFGVQTTPYDKTYDGYNRITIQSGRGHSVNDPFEVLSRHFMQSTLPDGVDAWWERLVKHNPTLSDMWRGKDSDKGLTAAYKKTAAWLDTLKKESPVDWFFFQWLRDPRTKDKRCNNNLLATFLNTATSYEDLKNGLVEARTTFQRDPFTDFITHVGYFMETQYDPSYGYSRTPKETLHADGIPQHRQEFWFKIRRSLCLGLPGAKERVEELDAKADWTKQKDLTKQADALGIDDRYPLLRSAVINGDIPTSVFHQPDKTPVNVEFALWEKSLARKGWSEVLFAIAKDAARHSTYEKDITPYMAFLFKIERYLDKHAPAPKKGKGWVAMPKYVESQYELEMDEKDEDTGTVKRRSAMTPIADNDTRTITVPFVAMAVSGVRTQWCYSRHYHLFEEGFTDPESGGVVVNDLEVKLNGRDDYGLCYYTLNGTVTAQGYPTFLTIFERLSDKTRVHFHRVRPCRVKDGIKTPACRLVEACYQYMAGNVPASDIVAQQGDLMFLRCNDPIKAGAKVGDKQEAHGITFESHKMESLNGVSIALYDSTAKQPANRLGYVYAPAGMRVAHPEHEDINRLEEGWWEIRRAKSWEANPKSIWSLTID